MTCMYYNPNNSQFRILKLIFKGNIVQTVIKNLGLSRNIQDANPNFIEDCVTLKMTVTELIKYMRRYEINYFYFRKDILKINKPKATKEGNAPKRQRKSSVGSDIYMCNLGRRSKPRTRKVIRNTPTRMCGCGARFTVRYPSGYEHMPDNGINGRGHGEKIVTVTWNWKHNHNFNDGMVFAGTRLSGEAKTLLKIAVVDYRVTWHQIKQEQKRLLATYDGQCPHEIMKIGSSHVRYYHGKRELSQNSQFKHTPMVVSFEILIKVMRYSGGFAEYTTDFRSTDTSQELKEFEHSQKRPVWSLVIISAWQKSLLQQNAEKIHLEPTHNTCYELQTDEKVYFFTIHVESQATGSGAPAAFMLSNSGKAPVIADFLRKIRSFTDFSPKQAVIDCDQAAAQAFRFVWGPEFPIIYCRSQVEKKFREGISSNIGPSVNKEQTEIEVWEDFVKVCKSETKDIDMIWLLEKYKEHKDLLPYFQKWFAMKEFFIEGYDPKYVRGEDTKHLVESFHGYLKSPLFLENACDRRPEVVAHQLFTFVVPSFKGKEKKKLFGLSNRNCNKTNTLAKLQAMEVPPEKLQDKVFLSGEGEVTVRSFTDSTKDYIVYLELAGSEKNTCTCAMYGERRAICKHIFLAERFWDTNTFPKGKSPETRKNESPTLPNNGNLGLIREVANGKNIGGSSLIYCSNDENESFSDILSSTEDSDNCDKTTPIDLQTDLFMASSTPTNEDAKSFSQNLFDTYIRDELTGYENEESTDRCRYIITQSFNIRPQDNCHITLEELEQMKELGGEITIAMADELLIRTLRKIIKHYCQLKTVEEKFEFVKSFRAMADRIYEESRITSTEERC